MSSFNDPLWNEGVFDEDSGIQRPTILVSLDAIPTVSLTLEPIPSARMEIL